MKEGDLVVVPSGDKFYIAEVVGPAIYDISNVENDSSYRRAAKWLNGKVPIMRRMARAALLSRMKIQGTSADAADLITEIQECLTIAEQGSTPNFQNDLHARLVEAVRQEFRTGRIESFGFERLIQTVLYGLGASEVRIISRLKDKGADLIATFQVAKLFQQSIAIQAKHWKPEPPVGPDVVDQLIRGIEAESATLGMIITSGSISPEAVQAAERYFKNSGIRIELVDGEQFAKIIIEHGVGKSLGLQ